MFPISWDTFNPSKPPSCLLMLSFCSRNILYCFVFYKLKKKRVKWRHNQVFILRQFRCLFLFTNFKKWFHVYVAFFFGRNILYCFLFNIFFKKLSDVITRQFRYLFFLFTNSKMVSIYWMLKEFLWTNLIFFM